MRRSIRANIMKDEKAPLDKHSAGGIIIHHDKVLVLSWTTKHYICLPKGGINKGETSEQAAVREVAEETGYNTRIIAPLGSWTYEFHREGEAVRKTVDYYLLERIDDAAPAPRREPGEDFENVWLSIDEAMVYLSLDDAKAALKKALLIRGTLILEL